MVFWLEDIGTLGLLTAIRPMQKKWVAWRVCGCGVLTAASQMKQLGCASLNSQVPKGRVKPSKAALCNKGVAGVFFLAAFCYVCRKHAT